MDLKTRIVIFAYLKNLKAPSQTHFLKHYLRCRQQVERKYDLGVATVTDYNAAVSAVRKARSQLIVAKYEYLFKRKIVQYYTQ